jgi:hypothetical protein
MSRYPRLPRTPPSVALTDTPSPAALAAALANAPPPAAPSRARSPVGLPRPPPPSPARAFTISQFCEAFQISRGMYHKLKKQGLGPREMIIGTRRLITIEAAREWVREREATVAKPRASPYGVAAAQAKAAKAKAEATDISETV